MSNALNVFILFNSLFLFVKVERYFPNDTENPDKPFVVHCIGKTTSHD